VNGEFLKISGGLAIALGVVLLVLFGAVAITLLLARFGILLPWSFASLHLHDSYYVMYGARPIRVGLQLISIPLVACILIISSGWFMRTLGHEMERSAWHDPRVVK
jgi:hypothetical protein